METSAERLSQGQINEVQADQQLSRRWRHQRGGLSEVFSRHKDRELQDAREAALPPRSEEGIMRYFVLAVCLSLLACSGDKTSPPAQDQGAGDGVVATTDGPVSGTEGGPGDGSLSPDASAPMTDRSEGEITSGAARSSGGNYVLYSQIGHAVRPVVLSGGSYSLRCNAAVIPW